MSQTVRNALVAVTTTSSPVCLQMVGQTNRLAVVISNVSTTETITIALGDEPAVANTGITLGPGGFFSQSTDLAFTCWQGAIQVVSTGASNIAVQEIHEV